MDKQPSPALLWEYDRLTPYKLEILRLCQAPTFWKQGGLTHSITVLYGMIEAGLLTGPKRGKPYEVPFVLTGLGRTVLAKLDRGLHRPDWLSDGKALVLELVANHPMAKHELLRLKANIQSILSLRSAGYIESDEPGHWWAITDLGREAFRGWLESRGAE